VCISRHASRQCQSSCVHPTSSVSSMPVIVCASHVTRLVNARHRVCIPRHASRQCQSCDHHIVAY
jgi:hypothetical protein